MRRRSYRAKTTKGLCRFLSSLTASKKRQPTALSSRHNPYPTLIPPPLTATPNLPPQPYRSQSIPRAGASP
eukprot:223464-Pyramimonas_sp.AAC.3